MDDKTLENKHKQVTAGGVIPQHIAIIMDGNGRWAKERNLPRIYGHNEGINSVREVTRECGQLGVKVLTLYTFSVENWRRPRREVSALMNLLLETIRKEVDELNQNNVRLTMIGRVADIPPQPLQGLQEGVAKTRHNTGLNLNLALSYGGRQEIIDAVRGISRQVKQGKLQPEQIDEALFSSHLYTAGKPDPDLLIRTSGELRISNFLLWQLAYTEIYITPVYWPDFRQRELLDAILDYQRRERRFGKTSEQLKDKHKGK